MRVAIIEDEPLAVEILQSYIQKISFLELVGVCKNAIEGFALISKNQIDLLLLDINLPEILGIDFLKSLKKPPLVIFTTAYTEFAIESYELNAVDYLLKPFSFERFLIAINKANDLKPTIKSKLNLNNKDFFVRSDGKWVKIEIDHLWLIEGLKDYLKLWIKEDRIIIHNTMKNFEQQLSEYPNFSRIHKSYIVNLNFIEEVENNVVKINGMVLNIGETYKPSFMQAFGAYKLNG